MISIQQFSRITLITCLFSLPSLTQANPVACFNSNMGNFCIELLATQAPNTTTNFLNYVNNEAYTSGIFHRSVPGFVVQAGGFKIVSNTEGNTLEAIETLPPIANEFKISNTRGTVAMAKVPGDPDSATSQWFVNLNDNASNLDSQNGGFTVFGRILFDGMNVIDAIGNLSLSSIDPQQGLTEVPTISTDGTQVTLVVTSAIDVTDVSGVFSGGFLSFAVDAGESGLLDVSLRLIEDNPDIIFELDPNSITPIQALPENGATFSSLESTLTIPTVMINETTTVSNVVMSLTDPINFQFTLVSMEQN